MALADDLERMAAAAAAHGSVSAVLACEPAAGVRRYVVALGDGAFSPFAEAMKLAVGSIEELKLEVETSYKGGLGS